jgi:hypothetical protein
MSQTIERQGTQLLLPLTLLWLAKTSRERTDIGRSAGQEKNGGRRLLNNGENLVAFGARKTAQSMHLFILV